MKAKEIIKARAIWLCPKCDYTEERKGQTFLKEKGKCPRCKKGRLIQGASFKGGEFK